VSYFTEVSSFVDDVKERLNNFKNAVKESAEFPEWGSSEASKKVKHLHRYIF
jgi:hypothetical protein